MLAARAAVAGLEVLVGSYSSIPLALLEERERCRIIHVEEVVQFEQNGELFFGELFLSGLFLGGLSHDCSRRQRSCMVARLLFHGTLFLDELFHDELFHDRSRQRRSCMVARSLVHRATSFGELSHGRSRQRGSCMVARLLFHGALVFGLVGERLDERLPFVISVCRGTPLWWRGHG